MKDTSLFFLVLSLGCVWLVLDDFYGNKFVSKFIIKMIPKSKEDGESFSGTFFSGLNAEDLLLNGATEGTADQREPITATVNGKEVEFEWNGKNYVSSDGMILQ